MKKAFLLKNNWIEIFNDLSDKQAGVLIKALFDYNVKGEKPADLTDIEVKAYFNVMLLDCNAMNASYDRRCETSVTNGRLGGRPSKTTDEEKPKKPNNLSKADNENENEKDLRKKEIKKETVTADAMTPPPTNSRYAEFVEWQKSEAPNVLAMKEPISEVQFEKLMADYSAEQVAKTLRNMHNWPKLSKNNVSAFLTAIKWMEKDGSKKDSRGAGAGAIGVNGAAFSENERKYGSTSDAKAGVYARIRERDLQRNGGVAPSRAAD